MRLTVNDQCHVYTNTNCLAFFFIRWPVRASTFPCLRSWCHMRWRYAGTGHRKARLWTRIGRGQTVSNFHTRDVIWGDVISLLIYYGGRFVHVDIYKKFLALRYVAVELLYSSCIAHARVVNSSEFCSCHVRSVQFYPFTIFLVGFASSLPKLMNR